MGIRSTKQQQGEYQRREVTDARAGGGIWLSDERFMRGLRWDQSEGFIKGD